MRVATTLLVSVALVASLAACSTPSAGDPNCAVAAAGSASNSVKVTGKFGDEPKVDFATPLTAPKGTERTVVIAGDGDTVKSGDNVNVKFSLYGGETAKTLAGSDWTQKDTTSFPVDSTKFLTGIVKTLECSTVGSRVVSVIPPVDAFGDAGSPDLGVGAKDAVVFVVDIVSIDPPAKPTLPKADGADQPATAGFPTVVLDDEGRPTVTIPDTAPPTDFQLALLKKGTGAVVAAGDDVTVHYEGINWNTKAIFDESWARGEPSSFNTAQVIPGFTQALVGQAVGSQVIVIIPPDLGYGPQGGKAPDISATDTLVFVVDILGIA